MTVYRYKENWKAEVWVNKKRIASRSGFATKPEAQKWHDVTIGGFHRDPDACLVKSTPSRTFEDLLEKYLTEHLPTVRVGTQVRYRLDIEQRIRPFFEFSPLNRIDAARIENFRASLMKTDLSRKSINNCTDTLRQILRKGFKWGWLEANPFSLDSLKIPQQKFKWWDDKAHIKRFLAAAKDSPYYGAFLLALECGMRVGEIVGLSKQDVNFSRCQIHVHRQWLDSQGCYGPPKHNRERRISFEPESELCEALRMAIEASPDREVIFVTASGRRVGSRNLAAGRFKHLVRKAGIPMIRFHDMRHTFASWFMIDVGDIWTLMGILGHSSIQTTMRYSHLSSKFLKVPAINRFETLTLPTRSRNELRLVNEA